MKIRDYERDKNNVILLVNLARVTQQLFTHPPSYIFMHVLYTLKGPTTYNIEHTTIHIQPLLKSVVF